MKTNVFYHGDCLFVMKHDIPKESIDLIYLDPPFFGTGVQKGEIKNTKGKSIEWDPGTMQISYDDSKKFWSNQEIQDNAPMWMKGIATIVPKTHWQPLARYLYYMYERLLECKNVLKRTGSIYLHCDWHASHYLKMVMDDVFEYKNFRREIIWWRDNPSGGKAGGNNYIHDHDVILYYVKDINNLKFNKPYLEYTKEYIEQRFKHDDRDGRGLYRLQGVGKNKRKQYLRDSKGKPVSSVWEISDINVMAKERIGYPTQKPKALLNRIIEASSNPMGIVLDPFCGCGTTIEVAHELGRRWIGIDMNDDAIDVIKQRLNKMGLTQSNFDFEIKYPVFKISSETIKKMNGLEFEKWVNKICNAKKPNPDMGVDGIMKDGTPIQTKVYKVRYDVVGGLLSAAEFHPKVPKPIKKMMVVSREGFDESAWQLKTEIELKKGIKVELKTPEDLTK